MPSSPVSRQQCRYSVLEVNVKRSMVARIVKVSWFQGQAIYYDSA